ncbi:MAG: serine/threonine-protein phosphatase [Spirochaetes bacterium]|nr:serine/threonine-protein phosphatase [Spirochaetota bacterium]
MKRSAVLFLLLAGLVLLNTYFFNKASEFSSIYPFERIIRGNTLTNKLYFTKSHFAYGSKIIKIQGVDVDSENFMEVLSGFSSANVLEISVIDNDNKKINTTIYKTAPNYNYLFLLTCLLFFAGIHYIWACVVYFIRSDEIRARLFSISSLLISLFCYSTIDLFTFNEFNFIIPAILLLAGYMTVLIGNNLTARKISKSITGIMILFVAVYTGIQVIVRPQINHSLRLLFIYLALCILYLTYYFLSIIIKSKNPAFTRRYLTVLFATCIGYLLPVLLICKAMFTESGFPVFCYAAFSLIFPVIMGTSFIKYSQYDFYGFKIIQRRDIKLFVYNIAATVLISSLLFSIVNIYDAGLIGKWYIIISVILILMLLNILHFINNTRKLMYENKDQYAISVQKITEDGSSPETLRQKIEFIFQEIRNTTGAESLKLILFMNSNYEYYSDLKEYIEIIPKTSAFFSFVKKNSEIIIKHSLVRTSQTEGKIYRFLEERDSALIITVIENEKIGVLLTGEKEGSGYYSFADMHYLKSITNQLFQIIYSDWLQNDYLLKKQYENELDQASYVQMRLFPKVSLDRDRGMDISFFYRPYLRVIGDYFDFFKLDEDHTAIIIGDVSGHGLSTAMILSAVNGITNAMLREVKSIDETCYEINNFLTNSYKGIELITLFIGIFNKKTKILEYVNAGHGAPLLIRKNEKTVKQIEGRTKILGADPEAKYTTSTLALNTDDELILYTDGVMEIYDEDTGNGINEEEFIQIIYDNIGKSIDNKIIEIEKNIKIHTEAIRDDITIIGVKIH